MTQEEEVKQFGVWTYLENAVFSYHGCVSSLNLVRQMKTASKIYRMDFHTVKAASESDESVLAKSGRVSKSLGVTTCKQSPRIHPWI